MGQEKRTGTELHYFSRQLKSKLDKMRRVPATLVEAPSGYGKTTAVQDFLEAQVSQNTPVYWFTAMEETPAAAFRRLCRAIDGIDSSVGERLLKMELPNAATIGEATDALRSLQCNHEAYLVLDNFQFLQEFLPPAFFVALLEHSGRDLHIIIVTQMLRRNILAAVTGRGFLHITASDLRLSAGDIRSYYALAGVSITPEEALGIERYTEGWIIAVYLQLCSFMDRVWH